MRAYIGELRDLAKHLRHPDVTLYALTDEKFCERYGLSANEQGRTLRELIYLLADYIEMFEG